MSPASKSPTALNKSANPRTQADGAWKQALDRWFKEFIMGCWTSIAAQINWDKPIEILDQELHALTNQSLVGRQVIDKLYKVTLLNGQNCFVLLHVEVQGDSEINFSRRLFEYSYKIYDRYQLPVLTLAVLSDDDPNWRPPPYEAHVFGYLTHRFEFQSIKLLDWTGKEDQLLNSQNPFENLIAIYLRARQTRQSPEARLKTKLSISRHLFAKGWLKDDILSFYTFLDGVMRLPNPLELEYHNMMINLEKEKNVNYITSAEYFGIQKGIQQGIQQGRKEGKLEGKLEGKQEGIHQARLEDAKNMLAEGIDIAVIKRITNLSDDDLASL